MGGRTDEGSEQRFEEGFLVVQQLLICNRRKKSTVGANFKLNLELTDVLLTNLDCKILGNWRSDRCFAC